MINDVNGKQIIPGCKIVYATRGYLRFGTVTKVTFKLVGNSGVMAKVTVNVGYNTLVTLNCPERIAVLA